MLWKTILPLKSKFLSKLIYRVLFQVLNLNVVVRENLMLLLLHFHSIIAHTAFVSFTLIIKLMLCGK